MADVVNPQVVDAVTMGSVKTIAETLAAANANLAQLTTSALGISVQNMVSSQQRANEIANMAMAAVLKDMASVDPMEAVSVAKTMTGNDLAQQLSALLSALNSGQQATKSAQTTPPVTP